MYAKLGIAIALFAFGFLGGWKVEAWRRDSADLERQNKAVAESVRRDKASYDAGAEHEDFKAKEEIRYVERWRTATKIIERPVYRNVCIDDDGVRIINDAIAGRLPAGEPLSAVPGSAAAAGR